MTSGRTKMPWDIVDSEHNRPPWTPRRALARGRIQSNGPPKTALRHEAAPKLAEHYHQWCKSQWDSKDPEVQLEAISTTMTTNACLDSKLQHGWAFRIKNIHRAPVAVWDLLYDCKIQMIATWGNHGETVTAPPSRVLRLHHNQEIDAILYNVNDLPSKDGMCFFVVELNGNDRETSPMLSATARDIVCI